MKRKVIEPRENWVNKVESLDFRIHHDYWNESAYYEFTEGEIDELYDVANNLHRMCYEVLNNHAHEIIECYDLPLAWKEYALKSMTENFTAYGRFDLIHDECGVVKMLEYNADTPTSLYEAAVVQWFWLQDRFPKEDQFNSIHEALIENWKQFPKNSPIYFSGLEGVEEDFITTRYMMDTAQQAGHRCKYIDLEQIGWVHPHFVDESMEAIKVLFKLYPYEWLMRDAFGSHINISSMRLIEPPWKYLLSNKVILALLWKYYPNHPNLLPAFLSEDDLQEALLNRRTYVSKPVIGREGNNIKIHSASGIVLQETTGPYDKETLIYQKYVSRNSFDGYYPTLGVWMVGNEARGLGIREDSSSITGNLSKFVPHLFTKE